MAHEYANMTTYAQKNLATFEEEPFNEVDSLILSWLVYLHFPEELLPKDSMKSILFSELFRSEYFEQMFVHVWSLEESLALLSAVVASPRYRTMRILFHQDELEHKTGKQFAAVTFELSPDLHYAAFRGTDWTLTGWEEDFRMSLQEPVPSQLLAAQYITVLANACSGELMVGGHSKGGNLAVFAAANCAPEIQDRILTVYSHDGPGFHQEDLEKEGFRRIQSKISKTVPQFSIFGMLFRQEGAVKTIHSHATGFMQHNSVFWEVDGYALKEHRNQSRSSQHLKNKINNWLDGLSFEKRALFINTIFDILEQTGVESFTEIGDDPTHYVPIIMHSLRNLDHEMTLFILNILRQLIFASDEDEEAETKKPELPDHEPVKEFFEDLVAFFTRDHEKD